MSRKAIAQEVLKRLRLGEPLGEELLRKFIRHLPELYDTTNGYDDFAQLRADVFSAYRIDRADKLVGFDLGACWGAMFSEESGSVHWGKQVTALMVENAELRGLVKDMFELLDGLEGCDLDCKHQHYGCIGDCYYFNAMRELGIEVD